MPQAARVGDITSHGSPLTGAGSATVLIGGLPAWRAVADVHTCPLSTPQPHGGGVAAVGSTSVMIDGFPAARQGDTITEAAGGPNAIVAGCPTVLIG
jgi:uncharacterized Zn-binding protein involved in type VI secretion